MLQGLMMRTPLLISSLITHADRHHGDVEIVSRRVEGDIHRTTYRELHRRSRQLANALDGLALRATDRVATLAWNGYRHMELYFAVSGSGAVLHTINPRLHPEQIAWIVNHAEDRALFFDLTFLPLIEAIAPHCKTVQHWVAMTDREHMPAASKVGPEVLRGRPRQPFGPVPVAGVRREHRVVACATRRGRRAIRRACCTAIVRRCCTRSPRHCRTRSTSLRATSSCRWCRCSTSTPGGCRTSAPMVGCKIVFPGPHLDGKSLHELFETEKVTCSAGVPTVWQGLLTYTEANGLRFSTMNRTVIGGSACPPAMIKLFQEKYGVHVLHAWGMTEMSPLGTACTFKAKHLGQSAEERLKIQYKQGRVLYGVDMKIVGDDGGDLPWDGTSFGDLLVRGPWVMREYYKDGSGNPLKKDPAGVDWFPTGDVATIDAEGYMHITDRSKDVIKSGGEWISSIEIENVAVSHPAVAMAACIAARHPKWDERPLLVVMKKPNAAVTKEELLAHYEGKVAKWQVPDDVVFVEAIPLGATGKMLKTRLRDQFADYKLPTA